MLIDVCQSPPDRLSEVLRDTAENRPSASGVVSLFDMLQRYAFGFYEVVSRLEALRAEVRFYCQSSSERNKAAPSYRVSALAAALIAMRNECETLDLMQARELISHIESEVHRGGEDYTYANMLTHLDTLAFSFAAELRRNSCFRIAADKEGYFEKDDLFGADVSKAFGTCAGEVRNAGNCYALEQYEACAFHSMRVLERGLGVLAAKLGLVFSNASWNTIIEGTEKQIRKMDAATFGPDWKVQQKFYAQAATHFMFLKDAWRNHIMHVSGTPYDEGRALSVLDHVRQFMQALAEGGLSDTP